MKYIVKQDELKVRNYAPREMNAQRAAESADMGLEEANRRFNEELQRYQNGEMDKNEMSHLGNPNGVMRMFLPDLPIVMRQRIVNKGSNIKHDVDVSALQDMPAYISYPIFVFKKNHDTVGILTDIKDRNGRNTFVAFDLATAIQNGDKYLEVNNVTTVHGRRIANIVRPILENDTLRWVNKEKALNWFSSASPYVQQEITNQELSTAANIVKNFENPTESGDLLYRDGEDATLGLADRYRKRVTSKAGEVAEAYQDSMRSVRILQEEIEKETGRPIADFDLHFKGAFCL